ncbi:MAG: sulfite exporter TauE/SafE family protein, partial [Defluviimonas denitrificans]
MFGTDPILLLTACAITLFAGTVKGAVGFAMPMIMISGLAS